MPSANLTTRLRRTGGGNSVTWIVPSGPRNTRLSAMISPLTSNSRARVLVGATSRRIICRARSGKRTSPSSAEFEYGPFPERGRKDLALGLQRLELLADQAGLVFAEVEKTAGQQRQRQHIDGEDAPSQRREQAGSSAAAPRSPAAPPRPMPARGAVALPRSAPLAAPPRISANRSLYRSRYR